VQRWIAIALFALSVLLHWPFGHSDFVYDDIDFVTRNASVQSPGGAIGALLSPFPPSQPERGLYRPLMTLSYALDFSAFGATPRGYHVVNALLYGGVVCLVYALARRYFGTASLTAFAAALLFAVHPVHCDAVDTVSGRSELLALAFSIASLLAFLRAEPSPDERSLRPRRRSHWLGAASGALYALGCLSKETAVLLPAVLVLHLLARDGAPDGARAFVRRALDRTGLHIAIACLYLALRLHVLGGLGPQAPVLADIGPLARASTMGTVFAEYLRLLVFPNVLQLDFYYQATLGVPRTPTAQSVVGWVGIALLGGGSLAACVGALRDGRSSLASPRGLWIAGIGTAFVFLLPVSHLLGIGALMAERFLFAPSLGLILFATGLAAHGLRAFVANPGRRRAIAATVLVALTAAGGARSALRAAEWRDGVELWGSLARLTPDDYRPYTNVAVHWIGRGELEQAERALRRALELEPDDAASNLNLAVVLLAQGEDDAAEAIHRGLLEQNPNDFNAWFNLGLVELERNRVASALEHFERTLAIHSNFEPARRQAASARTRVEAARRFIHERRAMARTSSDPDFLATYARACLIAGDQTCSVDGPAPLDR